jgi:hypothetical protein
LSRHRWLESAGTGVDSSARDRLEGEARGIPHLAKNERDVGHPAIGAGIEPKSAQAGVPQVRPSVLGPKTMGDAPTSVPFQTLPFVIPSGAERSRLAAKHEQEGTQ